MRPKVDIPLYPGPFFFLIQPLEGTKVQNVEILKALETCFLSQLVTMSDGILHQLTVFC